MYKIGDVVSIVNTQSEIYWYKAPENTIGETVTISYIGTDNRGNLYYGVRFLNKKLGKNAITGEYDWVYLPHQIGYQLTFNFNPLKELTRKVGRGKLK